MLKRIAVYDNSPNLLTLFDRILSKKGFEVMTSDSPMTCYEIEQFQVDLIILGYIRGYLDNELEALRQLRRNPRSASIPVIICTTGAQNLQNREEIINDDRLVVISKPFAIEELLAAVNLLFNTRRYNGFNLHKQVAAISSAFYLPRLEVMIQAESR